MSYREEWEEYKLSELMEIKGGGTPKTRIEKYWNGKIPWLSVVDFRGDIKTVYKTEKTITEEGLKNSSTKLLKSGQVIMSARGTVGELAVLGKDMAFNQSCFGLAAKKNITTNNFIYYLLQNTVENLKQYANGGVFDTINKNTFDTIKIKLPPLSTQKRIASILSAFDEKIEVNRQMNVTLEAMAQAMFREMCLPKDEEALEEGWEWRKIGDISDIHRKSVKPQKNSNTEYLHYSLPAFDSGKLPVREFGSEIKSSKYEVIPYCILVSKLNPRIPRVWTIDKLIDTKRFSICSTEFIVFKPNHLDYFGYLSQFFNNEQTIENLKSRASGTSSSHQRLKPKSLLELEIALPPIEIIKEFNHQIIDFVAKMNANTLENQALAKSRDLLLPKLMSGEIEV